MADPVNPSGADPNNMQNAQDALNRVRQMETQAQNLINELERKLNRAASKFRGQIDGLEDAVARASSNERNLSEFSNRIDNLREIMKKTEGKTAYTAKETQMILDLLERSGGSIEQFRKVLSTNYQHLGKEMQQLSDKLNTTSDDIIELFDKVVSGSHALRKSSEQAAQALEDILNGSGQELEKLQKKVAEYNKSADRFKLLKEDPTKTFNDFRAMAHKMKADINQFALNTGLDSSSTREIDIKIGDMLNKIDDKATKAQTLLSEMTEENAESNTKQIKRLQAETAMIMAGVQKEYKKQQEIYSQKRRIMELTAEGLGGLVGETQSVASSVSSGLSSLRNFNLVDAVRNFKQAAKTADAIQGAATNIANGSSNGAIRFVASMGKYFKWVAGIAGFLIAILALANAARDKAVGLNKTLMESQGLAGLGFKIGVNADNKDMEKELYDIRSELMGGIGDQVEFAVSAEEIMQTVGELGKQGVMVSELRTGGKSAADALKGVFTYSRLLQHDDQAMASMMGGIATDLGLSMTEVEHRFANMSAEWSGTRLSWDAFMGAVREISSEHGMFGDRMNEVSHLLSSTGKNSLLSSKQALESVKQTADLLDSMDAGKIRGLVEMSGGTDVVMKMMKERQTALEQDLRRRTAAGDKNTGPLKRQLAQINEVMRIYNSKGASQVEWSQSLRLLSLGQQASFFGKAAIAMGGKLGGDIANMNQAQLGLSTRIGNALRDNLGLNNEQYESLLNTVFSEAGGPEALFGKGVEKLEKLTGSIEDQSDQVKKNREEAAKAAKHLMTSAKAWQIATDQLMHKMYLLVLGISDIVKKIVETLTFNAKIDQAGAAIDRNVYGFDNQKKGSKEYYDQLKRILKSIEDFKASGASAEQVQQRIDSLPQNVKDAFAKIAAGERVADKPEEDYASKDASIFGTMPGQIKNTLGSAIPTPAAVPTTPTMPGSSVLTNLQAGEATKKAAQQSGSVLTGEELQAGMMLSSFKGDKTGWNATIIGKDGSVLSRATMATKFGTDVVSPFDGYILEANNNRVVLGSGKDAKSARLILHTSGFNLASGLKKNQYINQGANLGTVDRDSSIQIQALDSKGKEIGVGKFLNTYGPKIGGRTSLGNLGRLKVGDRLLSDIASDHQEIDPGRGPLNRMDVVNALKYLYQNSGVIGATSEAALMGINFLNPQLGQNISQAQNWIIDALLGIHGQNPNKDFVRTSIANTSTVNNNINIDVDPYKIVSMLTKQKSREARKKAILDGELYA